MIIFLRDNTCPSKSAVQSEPRPAVGVTAGTHPSVQYCHTRHTPLSHTSANYKSTQIPTCSIPDTTKTLGSTSIRHRTDTKVSVRCLIDVDPSVFAIRSAKIYKSTVTQITTCSISWTSFITTYFFPKDTQKSQYRMLPFSDSTLWSIHIPQFGTLLVISCYNIPCYKEVLL